MSNSLINPDSLKTHWDSPECSGTGTVSTETCPECLGAKYIDIDAVTSWMLAFMESWQEKLESWEKSYQLIEVGSELGSSVSGGLDLAYLKWKQGNRPEWWDALPYYGQHPVQGK